MNIFPQDLKKTQKNSKAIIHHIINNFIGFFITEKDSYDHYNRPTVVLTPGFTCTPGTMVHLGNALREYYNVAYSPKLPYLNTQSVHSSGILLDQKLQKVLKYTREWDINLIGHSLWGLIQIEALKIATDMKINNIISLSTPFHGTPMAEPYKRIFPACRDIARSWGYHKHTDISKQIDGKLIAHIAHDDSIVPPESQIPNPNIAKDKTKIINHPHLDHGDFLIWRTVWEVYNIIRNDIK